MDKPEALRLADVLMTLFPSREDGERAAAELRRLHAENERLQEQRDALLEALRMFVSCAIAKIDERGYRWAQAYLDQALPIARAAIKAVEGKK